MAMNAVAAYKIPPIFSLTLVREIIKKSTYPGSYNILLSNGWLPFFFMRSGWNCGGEIPCS